MKAAVYHGAGKPLALETLPDPEPGPDDVIVKVHRCGICGTDLHMTQGHQWDFRAGPYRDTSMRARSWSSARRCATSGKAT